jgi:hypothetical protein
MVFRDAAKEKERCSVKWSERSSQNDAGGGVLQWFEEAVLTLTQFHLN